MEKWIVQADIHRLEKALLEEYDAARRQRILTLLERKRRQLLTTTLNDISGC
jgi:hypothetical protein